VKGPLLITAVTLALITFPTRAVAATECAPAAVAGIAATPWAQQRLAPERAWVLTRGANLPIAVVDTGVSAAAPALAGAVMKGRDVATGKAASTDCSGHGTFVAGLIAARPTAGLGLIGIAPKARILPIRVTVDVNQVDANQLAKGIRAGVDGGARVVAVSVSSATSTRALRQAVAYAKRHDVLVVASTDAGQLAGTGPVYPAALPGVLAVASTGADGTASTGASTVIPALAAPGVALVSIAPRGPGSVTGSNSGVAVAFVAGTAALVRAYRPQLSAAQVRSRLEATADHPSTALPDPGLGYGIVDPAAALSTELPLESGPVSPPAPAAPLTFTLPPAADAAPQRTALTASAAVAGGGGLLAVAIPVLRRGRRRRWKPGPN
jgi:type VII secretion-associated serine protease mycosin